MLETRKFYVSWIVFGLQSIWLTFLRIQKFIFKDLPSTLYDFDTFNSPAYLSLPRLAFAIAGFMIVTAYVREHFLLVPFAHWGELIAFFSACSAGYVGKKFAERPNNRGD